MPVDFHLFVPRRSARRRPTTPRISANDVWTRAAATESRFPSSTGCGARCAPRCPPYDNEIAQARGRSGISRGGCICYLRILRTDKGRTFAWMNVPGGRDDWLVARFCGGPDHPEHAVSDRRCRNGLSQRQEVFRTFADFMRCRRSIKTLNPPFNVDGHSHFPLFIVDAQDFGPTGAKLRGSYQYSITMDGPARGTVGSSRPTSPSRTDKLLANPTLRPGSGRSTGPHA